MSKSINFNRLKSLLMDFAKSKGMAEDEIHDSWNIDYKVDIQKEYYLKELSSLAEAMSLFERAIKKGDDLTAKCALVDAEIRADMLSDFFSAIKADIGRVSRQFSWPKIPENYEIPDDYNYKDSEQK